MDIAHDILYHAIKEGVEAFSKRTLPLTGYQTLAVTDLIYTRVIQANTAHREGHEPFSLDENKVFDAFSHNHYGQW